jgi:hypothetical protein
VPALQARKGNCARNAQAITRGYVREGEIVHGELNTPGEMKNARQFPRALVLPRIAEIRGPDGYPKALCAATDGYLTKASNVWVRHERTRVHCQSKHSSLTCV